MFALVLEAPHNPPPIVGCLLWFWVVAAQIPAADFSFSKSFIVLAGPVFVVDLFAVDVAPRERFHRSSKFAEVAGLAGVLAVVELTVPGVRRPPPCCNGGGVGDMTEVLIL